MSEQLRGPEHKEIIPSSIESEAHTESHEKVDESAFEADQESILREASAKVEQEAVSGKEFSYAERADSKNHPVLINAQLKAMAYSRAMIRVQKKLKPVSRYFSKFTHAKIIDKPSEVLGNTIARPSGLLGGAFFALIGSSLLLWISKKYGYEYNYLAATALFATGLITGLLVELLIKALRNKSN